VRWQTALWVFFPLDGGLDGGKEIQVSFSPFHPFLSSFFRVRVTFSVPIRFESAVFSFY
jgi:hypothetical protein